MDPTTALFLFLCISAIIIVRRDAERLFLAVVMLAELCVSNIAWLAGNMYVFPAMDALVLSLCVALYFGRMEGWRLVFTCAAALQMLCDIATELDQFQAYTLWSLLMNTLAGLQLVALCEERVSEHVRGVLSRYRGRIRG